MFTKKTFSVMALGFIILLSACSKKAPSYTRYIPKESGNVIGIDLKSMKAKLESDSLSLESIIEAMKDTANPADYAKAISFMNGMKDAGIDWDNKIYVSISALDMTSYNSNMTVQVVAGLQDASKLEAYLKKQPETPEIRKGDGFSYVNKGGNAIGWNGDAIIVLFGENKHENSFDTNTEARPKSEGDNSDMAYKLKKYFSQDKKESMYSLSGFNKLQGEKSDINFFNQMKLEGPAAMAFAFVPKLKDLIDGAYSASTVNFEAGKVVMDSKGFLSDKMSDIIKKYGGSEADMSLIENYPSQNIDGAMTFSFKPAIIPALIKESGLDAIIGLGLAQTGMTMDDLASIFKGDFAVVFSDFKMTKKEFKDEAFSYDTKQPDGKMLFVAKIGNRALLEKLLNKGESAGAVKRNGNNITINSPGGTGSAINISNDLLTVTSDSATLAAYLSKTSKIGLDAAVKKNMSGKPMAMFVDFEKMMGGVDLAIFDSTETSGRDMLAKAKTTFKNVWFTVDKFSGNTVTSNGEMVFADSKKNSLPQLVRFGMSAAKAARTERENNLKNWDVVGNQDKQADVNLDEVIPAPKVPGK